MIENASNKHTKVLKSRPNDASPAPRCAHSPTILKIVAPKHKKEVVEMSINKYCENDKARFSNCTDFDTKRQFLLDFVEKVVFKRDTIKLLGAVPVRLKEYEDPDQPTDVSKIEF